MTAVEAATPVAKLAKVINNPTDAFDALLVCLWRIKLLRTNGFWSMGEPFEQSDGLNINYFIIPVTVDIK